MANHQPRRFWTGTSQCERRLHVEHLEGRRLLAVVTVDTDQDVVDFNDGVTSLREAIFATNTVPGADEIVFDFGHDGPAVILLEQGELEITDALTVTGDGPELLTVDAQQQSRIFNITATTGDFTLAGMTLTGGRTTGNNSKFSDLTFNGGAVRSLTTGNLTIDQSTVSGNSTTGLCGYGGGIFSRSAVTLTSSTVSGNSTADGDGGGIYSGGAVTLTNSTVSGNSTAGSYAGGGIYSRGAAVTLTSSTVSGNSATNGGGGISGGAVTLTNSTVSGNSTTGSGGGIQSFDAAVTLTSSTVSGNSAGDGGGIWNRGDDPISIANSIVAGNTADGGSNDIRPGTGTLNINYSLIGTGVPNASGNNVVSNTPQIGPLASNGGPTKTHALLPDSPAIDAGDPTIQQDLKEFDQRGDPFLRVADGDLPDDIVIDIGAYEAQSPASADFDQDGNIDGHDFLLWQRGYGMTSGAVKSDGNSDDDMDVDTSDLAAWEVTFGEAAAPLAASEIRNAPAALPVAAQHDAHTVSVAKLIDLAIVVELARSSTDELELALKDQLAVVEGLYDMALATDYALPVTSNSIEEDLRATSSAEGDDAEGQWLADELLERVFG